MRTIGPEAEATVRLRPSIVAAPKSVGFLQGSELSRDVVEPELPAAAEAIKMRRTVD